MPRAASTWFDAAREHGLEAVGILDELAEVDQASTKYRSLLSHASFDLVPRRVAFYQWQALLMKTDPPTRRWASWTGRVGLGLLLVATVLTYLPRGGSTAFGWRRDPTGRVVWEGAEPFEMSLRLNEPAIDVGSSARGYAPPGGPPAPLACDSVWVLGSGNAKHADALALAILGELAKVKNVQRVHYFSSAELPPSAAALPDLVLDLSVSTLRETRVPLYYSAVHRVRADFGHDLLLSEFGTAPTREHPHDSRDVKWEGRRTGIDADVGHSSTLTAGILPHLDLEATLRRWIASVPTASSWSGDLEEWKTPRPRLLIESAEGLVPLYSGRRPGSRCEAAWRVPARDGLQAVGEWKERFLADGYAAEDLHLSAEGDPIEVRLVRDSATLLARHWQHYASRQPTDPQFVIFQLEDSMTVEEIEEELVTLTTREAPRRELRGYVDRLGPREIADLSLLWNLRGKPSLPATLAPFASDLRGWIAARLGDS